MLWTCDVFSLSRTDPRWRPARVHLMGGVPGWPIKGCVQLNNPLWIIILGTHLKRRWSKQYHCLFFKKLAVIANIVARVLTITVSSLRNKQWYLTSLPVYRNWQWCPYISFNWINYIKNFLQMSWIFLAIMYTKIIPHTKSQVHLIVFCYYYIFCAKSKKGGWITPSRQ
jgi:hypothetical protein